jgi:hypothetical protein
VFTHAVVDLCLVVRYSALVAVPRWGFLLAGPFSLLAYLFFCAVRSPLAGSHFPNLSFVCRSVFALEDSCLAPALVSFVFCAWPFVLSACSCSGSRSYFCLHRNPLEPIFNFHLCVQECAVRSDYCWILLCDKYSSARSRSVAGLCLDLGTLNSFFCRRFVGHDTARPGVFFVAAPTGIFFRSARQFSSALTGSCCRKTIPLSDLFGANSVCPVS